ncbi:alpha/beta hydrolase [Protaetiibacter sp. SSC-01]|uniref:alpha/beta fold hydrolase n=1 Tax=Protaetiibacter sp. SSC-01 TaxID=2759943 RepID=UPI0016575EB9|nr:alpha/beta fold hydrolase [Protaetiibacter sp. SSC-01]QNO37322.1 alpha/beta hydrolase [Protaetiibacter sp. SSC-01]
MFTGFRETTIDTGEARILVRHHPGREADAEPVVLLHGHPRTSATWHRVAPALVERGFAVVCPDLRGYGRSRGPGPASDHRAASKRAMAGDVVAVARRLGYEQFCLAGHDRGSYVAFRLGLDHPERVRRLALLDCIPISDHLRRVDAAFATSWWHWFFYAQPEKPERAILADPDAWYAGDPEVMGEENHAEFRAATRDPEVVRAMLEDYRAGLTIDRDEEEADRAAGTRLRMPVLSVCSSQDLAELGGDPVALMRGWADDVRGTVIDSSHHMAEEAPEELARVLGDFFAEA